MDLIQLNSFVTVIECGSFSCAAQKLHMAHSTVTGHVQRLEQELDCTLIKRSTRSMAVTDKGQVVYRYAKQVLGGQTEMEAELKRLDCCHRINMAATSCISFGLIPHILSKYRKKKCDAVFNLMQGQDKEIQAMLCSGLISLGFIRKPCQNQDVECVLLGQSGYRILLPRGGAFDGITVQTADPADLTMNYPLVMAAKGEDSRTRIENRWLVRFGVDRPLPAPAVETFGTENIVNHVRSGLGFTLMPCFVAERVKQDPGIRILNVQEETLAPVTVYMIYRKAETNQSILDFIQFIRNWARLNQNREDIAFFE